MHINEENDNDRKVPQAEVSGCSFTICLHCSQSILPYPSPVPHTCQQQKWSYNYTQTDQPPYLAKPADFGEGESLFSA